MSHATRNSFTSRYPGPYAVHPGTDGVDNTFDIICSSTGDRIIAATYWEAEEEALLIACVVTLALEMARRAKRPTHFSHATKAKLNQFMSRHPGPYSHKQFVDDMRAEIGVAVKEGSSLLLSFVTHPDDPQAIADAHYMATALNRLFWPAVV